MLKRTSPLRADFSWMSNDSRDFFVEMAGVEQAKVAALDPAAIAQGLPQTLISEFPSLTSLVRPGAVISRV